MSQKSNHSKYDKAILDLVYRFKTIQKQHNFCLLKNCKRNSKIEERLQILCDKNLIHKCFFRIEKNKNLAYYCKNKTESKKPYWIPKQNIHQIVVEQIAFLKESSGSKIKCEDYIENSKVRYDIMAIEPDQSIVYYEIEISKKNKYEIREKVNEYYLIHQLPNVKLVFATPEKRDKAINHIKEYYEVMQYEANLISDYGIQLPNYPEIPVSSI